MKKIILFLISVFVSVFSATAQNIDDFFASQKTNKKVEYIHIDPEVLKTSTKILAFLSIFGDDLSDSDEEMLKLMTDLTDVEFLVAKNKDINLLKALKKKNFFNSGNYKYINTVTNKDEAIFVYGKKSEDGIISNLLIVLSDEDDEATIVANVKGNIRDEQIKKIIAITRTAKWHKS